MPKYLRFASLYSVLFVTLLHGIAFAAEAPRRASKADVELTFAFFGCNRIDAKDWEAAQKENPSSANIPQLRQNLTDIAQLTPDYLFFGGDLVIGYADDRGERLRSQMQAWVNLVTQLPRSPKTRYVAISGNHELNRKVGDMKLPNPANDAIWTTIVRQSSLIPADAKGPLQKDAEKNKLMDEQRFLNYSFNRGSVHFVVLNTDTRVLTIDPKTNDTKIGMVPIPWLVSDLDAAERDPNIKMVVVLGHRNLIDPESAKGDAPIDSECSAPMLQSLETHRKVRAYVCAHVHAFDITSIGNSGLKQVIFGNGGSKLEKDWNPKRGRTFGFGYFKVYTDGSLGVIPYLRPEPKDYLDSKPEQVPPATPEAELIIPVR